MLEASIQRFGEMAGTSGFEISDWRLMPNFNHVDLLLEARFREEN
ncbi:hypothetical protein Z946_603 [Sulfitobacter noctilucicola]|nr:hypothetical protein Z946_603 [Sulfitobacter noctilucicola]